MKKLTKVCLIVSLVLLCTAVVCICAGTVLGSGLKEVLQMADNGDLNFLGWKIGNRLFYWDGIFDDDDISDIDILKGAVDKSFPAKDIKNLDIDLDFGDIVIEDSDSENITVTIDASGNFKYVCKTSGATLVLEETTKSHRRNWASLKADADIHIGIPAGSEFDEVDFSTSVGEVNISHSLYGKDISLDVDAGQLQAESVTALKELELETGAGELVLYDFSADEVSIDCGVGKVDAAGKVNRDLEATCGVGSIALDLKGDPEDYDYDLSCGVGSISINEKKYSALGGGTDIDNNGVGEILLDCGVGSIEVTIKE